MNRFGYGLGNGGGGIAFIKLLTTGMAYLFNKNRFIESNKLKY